MRDREIFRYSNDKLDYIAMISEHEDFIPPKGYENSISYWISLAITRTSTRRNGRDVGRDYNSRDGRMECNVENGYKILKDLMALFKKWLDKENPEFLTIAAYQWDCLEKRLRIYKQFLNDNGYDLYLSYKDEDGTLIYQFCRSDLDFKRKVL